MYEGQFDLEEQGQIGLTGLIRDAEMVNKQFKFEDKTLNGLKPEFWMSEGQVDFEDQVQGHKVLNSSETLYVINKWFKFEGTILNDSNFCVHKESDRRRCWPWQHNQKLEKALLRKNIHQYSYYISFSLIEIIQA